VLEVAVPVTRTGPSAGRRFTFTVTELVAFDPELRSPSWQVIVWTLLAGTAAQEPCVVPADVYCAPLGSEIVSTTP
jgi:hypothetical protein